jgi:hypothetical protein
VNGRGQVITSREALIRAVLALLTAERELSGEGADVVKVMHRERDLSFAAAVHAHAIDDLPAGEKPKGWVTR